MLKESLDIMLGGDSDNLLVITNEIDLTKDLNISI